MQTSPKCHSSLAKSGGATHITNITHITCDLGKINFTPKTGGRKTINQPVSVCSGDHGYRIKWDNKALLGFIQ